MTNPRVKRFALLYLATFVLYLGFSSLGSVIIFFTGKNVLLWGLLMNIKNLHSRHMSYRLGSHEFLSLRRVAWAFYVHCDYFSFYHGCLDCLGC